MNGIARRKSQKEARFEPSASLLPLAIQSEYQWQDMFLGASNASEAWFLFGIGDSGKDLPQACCGGGGDQDAQGPDAHGLHSSLFLFRSCPAFSSYLQPPHCHNLFSSSAPHPQCLCEQIFLRFAAFSVVTSGSSLTFPPCVR